LSLDPHAKRLLDILAAMTVPNRGPATLKERRQSFEKLMQLGHRSEPIKSIEELSAPGPVGPIALRQYTPSKTLNEPASALVYFHGGGLFAGGLDTHDAVCRVLANATGCSVISVAYRLAPECPFPAAIDDGCAAVSWIMAHATQLRLAPTHIGVAGDSAGANIAAVICQLLKDVPGSKLALQLLLCPILDWCTDTDSRRTFGSGYLIDTRDLALELEQYRPEGGDMHDSRVSPLLATDLAGLPTTYIHTAEFDPLRDEGQVYADRLRSARIEVHYTCHPGMIHMFYALPRLIPYADTAMQMIAAQLAPAFKEARA
jgi:acetyl esterase